MSKSTISDKNIEKNLAAKIDEKQPTKEKKSSFFPGFWSVAIPAYCYFFGYTAFRFELDTLGFESPQMPTAPGDVYFHAFDAFIFLTSKSLPHASELLLKHFFENWLFILCLSIVCSIVTFFFVLFIKRKKKKIDSVNKNEWKDTTVIGLKSFGLAVAVFVGNFMIMPIILLIMAIGGLLLLPPAVLGMGMGKSQLENFRCDGDEATFKLEEAHECSRLEVAGSGPLIGKVIYQDEHNVYILTKNSAITLSKDKLEKREKSATTGKQPDSKNNDLSRQTQSAPPQKEHNK